MTPNIETPGTLTLHGYFRSSAAYRVRIALNLKKLDWIHEGVHLVRGEQRNDEYLVLNPQGLVPTLQDGDFVLTQSLAIIEYLDEMHPEPPLLPRNARDRARARQIAATIACDIHPLNNLRVLKALELDAGLDQSAKQAWTTRWIAEGFGALEIELSKHSSGAFCVGNHPSVADCCLVPQMFNAQRFGVDLEPYPRLRSVTRACEALVPFRLAHPGCQMDAA